MQADLQGSGRCHVLKKLWWILVFMELPKIPSVVGLQGSSRRRKTFRLLKRLRCVLVDYPKSQGWLGTSRSSRKREISCVEEVWYSLVELPEIPSVVWIQGPSRRRKTFRWLEGLRCKLVELLGVVGIKGKSSMVVDGLASSLS